MAYLFFIHEIISIIYIFDVGSAVQCWVVGRLVFYENGLKNSGFLLFVQFVNLRLAYSCPCRSHKIPSPEHLDFFFFNKYKLQSCKTQKAFKAWGPIKPLESAWGLPLVSKQILIAKHTIIACYYRENKPKRVKNKEKFKIEFKKKN